MKFRWNHLSQRYFADVRPFWTDLSPYRALTKNEIEVPVVTTITKQHFWSADKSNDSIPRNELGDRLVIVFNLLFDDVFRSQLPHEQKQALYRQRIAIWNSDFPERATPEDIKKLMGENQRLFPSLAR